LISTCKPGYAVDFDSNTCVENVCDPREQPQPSPSSSSSSSGSVPVVCPDGQYEHQGKCYNCSAALFCATCSDSSSCLTCKDNYILVDNKCQPDCGKLFGEGCSKCNSKRCIECEGEQCCSNMKYFWNSTSKKCSDPAEVFGNGCLESDGVNCTKCTAQSCCGDKQYVDLNTYTCLDCSSFGNNCGECTAAGCVTCGENEIVSSGGKCASCSEVFGMGCDGCSQTKCEKAKSGYFIVGSMAKECKDLFGESCSECDMTDGCTECSEGYQVFGGFCKNCSEVFGYGCDECSNETKNCTKMSDEITDKKLVNGVVADVKDTFGEGCQAWTDDKDKCKTAESGYFISGGLAISCSALPTAKQSKCYHPGSRSVSFVKRDECESDEVKVEFEGEQCILCNKAIPNCSKCDLDANSNIICSICADGFVLYGGVCKACSEVHGDSCDKCSVTECTERICGDGNVNVLGECQKCDAIFSQCSTCSLENNCTQCEDGFVPDNEGGCVTCQSKHGEGCSTCTADECSSCTAEACAKCEEGKQVIIIEGKVICDTCNKLTAKCTSCTSTECTSCESGMAVDSGVCKSCSELFDKCGKCDSDKCIECSEKEGWILTENGCYKADESSSSSSSHQSKPIVPSSSSSSPEKDSKAGMIAGIVIGVLAAVAIIAIAIYCVATSGPKYGKMDSGIYEEDPQFVSMSVL